MCQDDLATGPQNNAFLVTHTPFEAQRLRAGQLGNAQAHVALRHKKGHGFLGGFPHALHDGLSHRRDVQARRPHMGQLADGRSQPEPLGIARGHHKT